MDVHFDKFALSLGMAAVTEEIRAFDKHVPHGRAVWIMARDAIVVGKRFMNRGLILHVGH